MHRFPAALAVTLVLAGCAVAPAYRPVAVAPAPGVVAPAPVVVAAAPSAYFSFSYRSGPPGHYGGYYGWRRPRSW